MRRPAFVGVLAAALLGSVAAAFAQAPLFEEIRTVSSVADPAVSDDFTVTAAGDYDIRLTDLGAQLTPAAPLAAVQAAVMRGTTVVTKFTAAGAKSASLGAGTYHLRVTGTVGDNAGSGLFSMQVVPAGGAAPLFTFAGALSPRATVVPSNVRVFQGAVDVASADNYVAEITDLAFPTALQNASLLIVASGGTVPTILDLPGAPPLTTRSTTFAAGAGTFDIFALGDSPAATNAGLFSVTIRNASTNAVVFSRTLPVGQVSTPAGDVRLDVASYTLVATDLAFPVALRSASAIVTRDGAEIARGPASPAGVAFNAPASGAYQVHAHAQTAASPGAGSLAIEVQGGSGTPYSSILAAGGDATTGTPLFAYAFDLPGSGIVTARTADLQFPGALAGLQHALVQNGAVVARRDTAGSANGSLAKGRAHALVFATPPAGSGSLQQRAGLFSLDVAPAGEAAVLQRTQGVGAVFSSRSFSIVAQGDYRFTVDDVGFPAAFVELAAAVTRGTERLGLIYGAGSFDVIGAPTGAYTINFLSRVDPTLNAGTYRVAATTKPANPEITLLANPASPANGATTTLTWSATNATSCTASAAWTGSRPTSGTEQTAAIDTATTYTLACTGDGGTTAKTLTVTPSVPTNSASGGGSMDAALLMLLATTLAVARWRYLRRRELMPE